jgi:hypothetical protein
LDAPNFGKVGWRAGKEDFDAILFKCCKESVAVELLEPAVNFRASSAGKFITDFSLA